MNYLARYSEGDFVAVWNELIRCGDGIRREPLQSEAKAVAREIVDRAYTNLVVLRSVLLDLGYEFARPERVIVEASSADARWLMDVENQFGPLPIILRLWFERIACVDFRQAQGQLFKTEQTDEQGLDVAGLGCNCVLVFLSLPECLSLARGLLRPGCDEFEISSPRQERFLPLGAYASNNVAKGFWLPNQRVDGVYYNDGGGDMYFVDELRNAFASGGFPFWALQFNSRRHVLSPVGNVPNFPKVLSTLTENLVPV